MRTLSRVEAAPAAASGCTVRRAVLPVPPPLRRRAPPLRGHHLVCLAAPPPFRDSNGSEAGARTSVAVAAPAAAPMAPASKKTRVVVLGSGWGAVSFIKNLDPAAFGEHGDYELVLVSPRNYMLFTPLLPSAVGGVVSESSIVESIRNIMRGLGMYFEARAVDIDPATRTLTCVKEFCEVCARRRASGLGGHHTEEDHTFELPYDILLCSVGAVNATFGIPGVKEHCFFLKSMQDAQELRRHVSKTLEHAALPDVTAEERRKMLSFVVVGGGPTGVEVAAELMDLVEEDVARKLPQIEDDVSITVLDGLDTLLGSFHTEVQSYAKELFSRNGIAVRLGAKVTAVHDGSINIELKDGTKQSLPFGTCIWAAGVGMHPLVAGLKEKLPAELQTSHRGLLVDEHLRVVGSQGTIYCLGDAAVTGTSPQTALPPTAQVARQEGEYLAALFSKNKLSLVEPASDGSQEASTDDLVPLPKRAKPFRYFHLGSLAYLGSHKGVMDLPFKTPFLKTLRGYLGAQTWRFLETYMQVSDRTRWLVAQDWIRSFFFGRNISDI